MKNIGEKIKILRKAKGMKQGELAKRLKMTSAQLCRIEGSKNAPSVKTLARISKALGISFSDLMDEKQPQIIQNGFCSSDQIRVYGTNEETKPPTTTRLIPIRKTDDSHNTTETIQNQIISINNQYSQIETELGVSNASTLPLRFTFSNDERGAEILSRSLRSACDIGPTPFIDLVALLESKNVRVIPVRTLSTIQSRSYYDTASLTLSIAVNKKLPAERQLYRIAYELGYACIFGSTGNTTVIEEPGTHKFVRRFAAAFLMPEEAIKSISTQLALGPTNWTIELLLQLKYKFGVNAETFAHRLEKIGVLAPTLRKRFKEELRNYYEEHNGSEPSPRLKPLAFNSRISLLKLRANIYW